MRQGAALAKIGTNVDRQVGRKVTDEDRTLAPGRIRTTVNLPELGTSDIIIEAVCTRALRWFSVSAVHRHTDR
jgi:3-hydroxybutyryl-CoA dehydrogenase